MTEWIIIAIVAAVLIIAACMKVSGACSRDEERREGE